MKATYKVFYVLDNNVVEKIEGETLEFPNKCMEVLQARHQQVIDEKTKEQKFKLERISEVIQELVKETGEEYRDIDPKIKGKNGLPYNDSELKGWVKPYKVIIFVEGKIDYNESAKRHYSVTLETPPLQKEFGI